MQNDSIIVTSEYKNFTLKEIENHIMLIDQWSSTEYFSNGIPNSRTITFKNDKYKLETSIYLSENKFQVDIYVSETSNIHIIYFGISLLFFFFLVGTYDDERVNLEGTIGNITVFIFFLILGINEKKSMNKFEKSVCRVVKSNLKKLLSK